MPSASATGSADALVKAVGAGRQVPQVLPAFRSFLQEAVNGFSAQHSPRALVRLSTEVIPTHPKDVTAVRGRMGTIIELGLAERWNEFLRGSRDPEWRVTVNYVTEYPDLYFRDGRGEVRLRIETKALHDEADEGAARFDTHTPLINASSDILVVVGWRWQRITSGRRDLVYPALFAADAFAGIEIAQERDTRFRITGGVFRAGGRPFVRAKRGGAFVTDPGNYGKLNRIIHRSRRSADLSEDVRRLVTLLNTIFPARRGAPGSG